MNVELRAGVGKADITCRAEGTQCELLSERTKAHIPKEFWDKPITIDDPLYARALVLDDGERKLVLITMDTTAVGCRSISQFILNDSADDFVPNLRGLGKRCCRSTGDLCEMSGKRSFDSNPGIHAVCQAMS